MKQTMTLLSVLLLFASCDAQSGPKQNNKVVGGPFENSEYMYMGMPKNINAIDTSPGWNQVGQKICISGTIYENDGITPAPEVVLYYYHTDVEGLYSSAPNLDPKVKRHGYIRGWVKSDVNGKYAIYTVRPGTYPDLLEPAHIHPAILEPDIDNNYYLDAFVFDDDVLLNSKRRQAMENRGGSGVLRLLQKGEIMVAEKDIVLGLNIPDYPKSRIEELKSGRSIGEDVFSFTPYHAYGPDKGKKVCPICKYGRYHGVIYYVGNRPNWSEIKSWLIFLEDQSVKREKYLKVYFVYGNDSDNTRVKNINNLEKLGMDLELCNVALTFVPSLQDKDSEIYLNKINAEVENTFILYRNRNIVGNYVNLKPTQMNFKMISDRLDKTRNEFFDFEEKKQGED